MTSPGPLVVWITTAVAILFLAACAWYNHRAGYRRDRKRISPLAEALVDLEQLNESLQQPPEGDVTPDPGLGAGAGLFGHRHIPQSTH